MFADKLLNWYAENGRQLPWRGIDNPYFIWLSEIILQQTRIEQGMDYYNRFIRQYPTVHNLAVASEQEVLKTWQGLGYYSRARNLHAAAQYIEKELQGVFPNTYEGILLLKGVGKYTAAAIASFAYRLPYPVIDGNVYRFISRMYGVYTPIGTNQAYNEFEKLLFHIMDTQRPDLFNQALMDFGSIYCKPTGCDCQQCVFRQECVAFATDKVKLLPVKKTRVQVRQRYFYYFDIRWDDQVLVRQRKSGDIWQGLYEFPLYETAKPIATSDLPTESLGWLWQQFGAEPASVLIGPSFRHQLTHQTINAQFVKVKFGSAPPLMPANVEAMSCTQLKVLPISRLIDRYLSLL